jgi:hypothetical protein
MKKIFWFFLFFVMMTGMSATSYGLQWQGSDPASCVPRYSGMGGAYALGGMMGDVPMVMTGGALAFMFEHKYFVGGYGSWLATNHYRTDLGGIVQIDSPRISMNHTGVWFGYIHAPERRVQWGASMKAGGGRIFLSDPYMYYTPMDERKAIDRVFLLAPQLDLWVNLTCWMSFNLGVGYRYTGRIDRQYQFVGQDPIRYYQLETYSTPFVHGGLMFGLYRKPTQS